MNLDELQQKLIAAARAQRSDDRVPYAFSKRILARLQAAPAVDRWALWAHGLWRAAAACIAVALLSGAITFFVPQASPASNDLALDFEKTMLAAADQETELPQ